MSVQDSRNSASEQPGRVHDEDCGPKCGCNIMSQAVHNDDCANVEEDKLFLHHVLPGPGSLFYLKCYDCCTDLANDTRPGILDVSRQTRTEALALFYSENTFVVNNSEHFILKDWLFEVVGWQHMKHVRSLYCEFDETDSTPSDQDVVNFAVVILLMELRLLKCWLRATFDLYRDDHIGCKLRRKIRELVAGKPIVKADVEGKDVRVVEDLVRDTAVAWKTLWLDEGDLLGLGDANQEASARCTVCGEDEDENTLNVPMFESL